MVEQVLEVGDILNPSLAIKLTIKSRNVLIDSILNIQHWDLAFFFIVD